MVARDTPNSSASSVGVFLPSRSSWSRCARCWPLSLGCLPLSFPRWRALAMPSIVRSRMMSTSNSANEARMLKNILPNGSAGSYTAGPICRRAPRLMMRSARERRREPTGRTGRAWGRSGCPRNARLRTPGPGRAGPGRPCQCRSSSHRTVEELGFDVLRALRNVLRVDLCPGFIPVPDVHPVGRKIQHRETETGPVLAALVQETARLPRPWCGDLLASRIDLQYRHPAVSHAQRERNSSRGFEGHTAVLMSPPPGGHPPAVQHRTELAGQHRADIGVVIGGDQLMVAEKHQLAAGVPGHRRDEVRLRILQDRARALPQDVGIPS